MEERSIKTLFCVLKAIKYKTEISPNETRKELEFKKSVFKRIQTSESGLAESTERHKNHFFDLLGGKHIELFCRDLTNCDVLFSEKGIGNILKKLKQDKLLKDFVFKEDVINDSRYKIILPKDFEAKYRNYIFNLNQKGKLELQIEALMNVSVMPPNEKLSEARKKENENQKNDRQFQLEALGRKLDEGLKEEKFKKEIKEELLEEMGFDGKAIITQTINKTCEVDGLVKSILIITPQYSNFIHFWIVLNHDYEKKHRINMINKQTGQRNGVGNSLWRLYEEKKVDNDSSFLNYMNDKIFKVNKFKDFKKTKLVRIKDGKIMMNDNIILEKESKESLDKDIADYFS